jgi:putative ABC transport system permease protein
VLDALTGVAHDASFALRTLRRRAGFTATMLATVAIGIGATASMFSVINGVLLRDLPYREPGQLVSIYTTFPKWRGQPILGALWNTIKTSYSDYTRLVADQRSLTAVGGFFYGEASLRVGEGTENIAVGTATANLLSVIGVSPTQGRWFAPGEDGRSAQSLVVLSHELWQSKFNGAPMIDSTISVNGAPHRVIGILPRGFGLTARMITSIGTHALDLWVPVGDDPNVFQPGNQTLELIARLKPGVSMSAAFADVEPLLVGDRSRDSRGARMIPRAEEETGEIRRPLILLFVAVGLLLAITCGNVAMLFLSECAVRVHELQTRALLGAGRVRLVRLLLTESAMIATTGAVIGVGVAWWATRAMIALAPVELPHASAVRLDWRVCLFSAGVAGIVALISGAIPTLMLTRDVRTTSVSHGRVASGRSKIQTTVIALQAALSIVLVSGATLLSRSLIHQQHTDPGFRTARTLMLRVDLASSSDRDEAGRHAAYSSITERLSQLPGVERVAMVSNAPLAGRTNSQSVSPRPEEKLGTSSSTAERLVVSPNYFDVMRIAVRSGRPFDALDVKGSLHVGIVNEAFVRRFWPGQAVVGKQFRSPQGVLTVVGVVGDVRDVSLDRTPEAAYYLPMAQVGARMSFLMTTKTDPAALTPSAIRAIWAAAPGATVTQNATGDALVSRALAPGRYRATLASLFGGMALLLTGVGVAGLIARGVAGRLRELCIRMAVGATPIRAFMLAVARGMGAVCVGSLAGIVIAPITSRWLSEYVYGARASDWQGVVPTLASTFIICAGATFVATKRLRRVELATQLRDA